MVTTTAPARANAVPSYQRSRPEPVTNAPPWIPTRTGLRPASAAGAKTFRGGQAGPRAGRVDPGRCGGRDRPRRYDSDRYRGAVGRNWYRCDPTLGFLMRVHLGAAGLAWAEPHLDRVGALIGGPVAERAEETDRNPPRLERYDRWGHDVSRVVMPPSSEAARRDLVAHGFSTPAFREEACRAGVAPAPLAAARSYLLGQAEIGMAFAPGTGGGMVARLGEEYAPAGVPARVRELLAPGEMSGETA